MNNTNCTCGLTSGNNRSTGGAFLSAIHAGIDWFVPARVRSGDVDQLRRARLVVAFGCTLMCLAIIFTVMYSLMNSPISVAAIMVGAVVVVVSTCILRRTGSCFVSANLNAAVFFGVLTVLSCRLGGHGSIGLTWYAAVPVIALCTAGRRSAVFWLVVTSSSLAVFYALDINGFSFPHDVAPCHYGLFTLLSCVSLVVLMLGLALLYETAKDQTLSELNSAKERLQREKGFSDSIIASLPGVFYLFNIEGTFLQWNENIERITGYSPEEIYHMEAIDFFDDHEREIIKHSVEEVFTQGAAAPEARLMTKDGTAIPYLFSSSRIMLDGEPHLIGMAIDITERKRVEEALEKRILALTRPLEANESLIFEELFNLDEIQRLQDEFSRATGVSSIITHTDGMPITRPSNFSRLCMDIIRKTEKGCANCYKSDAVLGRFNPDGPIIHPCMSGGLWSAGTSITVGGKHIASWLIGQVRDQNQTDEKIREYARVIGADEEAAVEAFREVPTMSRERFENVAQALFTIAQHFSASAYQNVQQARFISEGKRSEVELAKARDEAEAANCAKSEFLANMSHEIRTPMTAILGFTDILKGTLTDRDQIDAATTIKQNGKYLLGIINDILDLSKIEAGKMDAEHIQCSPHEILTKVASLMRVRAGAKNLPLEIEYEGPIPQTIQSDPTQLRQILINLTGNAVKFTEVGEVRLVARLLHVDDDPKMQIDVVDTGIGMTEEQIARLFKPFHQADTSTTRKFGGTGLGLTISKRLAGKLGGGITVSSVLGQGSTFTLTVETGPLQGVEMLDNPSEAYFPDEHNKQADVSRTRLDCRVLLAEDGPDNQRLIMFLLKQAGAEVIVAENGKIAHDLALEARDEGAPFDVILMDMQMPVMDGYDATSKLREAGYRQPIIALTAHAMSADRDRCLAAGCDDYMTKPIDHAKLLALVSEYAWSGDVECPMNNS